MAERRKKDQGLFGGGATTQQPFYMSAVGERALTDWMNANPGLPPPPGLLDGLGGSSMSAAVGDPFQRAAANPMSARRGGKAPPKNTLFGTMGLGGLFG